MQYIVNSNSIVMFACMVSVTKKGFTFQEDIFFMKKIGSNV